MIPEPTPTVKVTSEDHDGEVMINKSDFNADKHTLVNPPAAKGKIVTRPIGATASGSARQSAVAKMTAGLTPAAPAKPAAKPALPRVQG